MQLKNQLASDHVFDFENLDGQARLQELVARTLRLPSGRTNRLKKIIISLRQGCGENFEEELNWKEWGDWLQALEKNFFVGPNEALTTKFKDVHPLALLLAKQPSLNFSRAVKNECLKLAAKGFFQLLAGVDQTKNFWVSLNHVFSSNQPGWVKTREHGLQNLNVNKALGESNVYTEFDRNRLALCKTAVPSAHLIHKFGVADGFKKWKDLVEIKNLLGEESTSKEKNKIRFPTKFCEDVRLDLFAFQILQQEVEPALNGYRLNIDWNFLSPNELRLAALPLIAALRKVDSKIDDLPERLHAACRLLTLFTGISLKTTAGLPIHRAGSMHVDLEFSVMRRDSSVVTPRSDRSDAGRWCGRWWRTPIPQEIIAVLKDALSRFPNARTIGNLMISAGLTPTITHKLLNQNWATSHRPEDLRFSRSLRPCLISLGIHPSVIARVTGDVTTTPISQVYYLTLSQELVYQAVDRLCDFIGLKQTNHPKKYRLIGSPRKLSIEDFKETNRLQGQLNRNSRNNTTARSCLEDFIKFHNSYIKNVALQMLWGVGARLQRFETLTVGRLLSDPELISITDKASDGYSSLRLCYISKIQQQTRLHLREHYLAMSGILKKREFLKPAELLANVATGKCSEQLVFLLIEKTKGNEFNLRGLKSEDLASTSKSLGINYLNSPRHFLLTEMVNRNVAAIAIDAQIGHHIVGAEPFGFGGGMSVEDFKKYLAPILDKFHMDIKMEPLVGLGRADPVRHKLPQLSVLKNLKVLGNSLLEKKIAVQDFMPPDRIQGTAHAPFSKETLVAVSHMKRLRLLYQSFEWVKDNAIGSLAFCLISFDCVVTEMDLISLIESSLGSGISQINNVVGIEVFENDRPVLQRLVSRGTAFAATKCRLNHASITRIEVREFLHSLLQALDKSWPAQNSAESTNLLLAMASHCIALEVSPICQIALFHKAPFIAMKDIERILIGKVDQKKLKNSSLHLTAVRANSGFKALLKIVEQIADKDKKIGEDKARKILLKDALKHHKLAVLDEAEELFCDWLIAECDDKTRPYKKIGLGVLHAYSVLAQKFFNLVRASGTIHFDGDDWLHVSAILGGGNEFQASTKKRWVVLHLAHWLADIGVNVPPGLVKGRAIKSRTLPHNSVYLKAAETDRIAHLLNEVYELPEGVLSLTALYLKIARKMPFRPGELRFLRWIDFDSKCRLMHVASSGHDHFKTFESHGSLSTLKNDEFVNSYLNLKKENEGSNLDLIFCSAGIDKDFKKFDKNLQLLQEAIRTVTGRQDARNYDLRANGISDLIFNLEKGLRRLAGLDETKIEVIDSHWISTRHNRAAQASREARHTNVLTTLRYYNLSAMIEVREQMDAATAGIPMSAAHLGGGAVKSPASIYCMRSRRVKSALDNKKISLRDELFNATNSSISALPTASLTDAASIDEVNGSLVSLKYERSSLIHASLLAASALPIEVCAQSCNISYKQIKLVLETLNNSSTSVTEANRKLNLYVTKKVQIPGHPLAILSSRLSQLACKSAPNIDRLLNAESLLVKRNNSCIHMLSISQFNDWLLLLKTLQVAGVQVYFQFFRTAAFELRSELISVCKRNGILVVRDVTNGDGIGAFRFGLVKNKANKFQLNSTMVVDAISPHIAGQVGKIVTATLLLTKTIVNLMKDKK